MNDIEAIQQVKARYFRLLDTKAWDDFRRVFTDDFVSDTTPSGGKVVTGADAFVAFVKRTLADRVTVHHGHTPEIELTSPESARGIWAMHDIVRMAPLVDMQGFGHYHEEYRKESGEWKISHSRLTRTRMEVRIGFITFKLPQRTLRRLAGD